MKVVKYCLASIITYCFILIPAHAQIMPCNIMDEACLVQAAGNNPNQRAAARAILPGSASQGIGACPNVNSINDPTSGQADFRDRCNELVVNSSNLANNNVRDGLGEMSVNKLSSEGTSFVEASNRNIGARIAALRGSATAISFGIFSLNINGQTLSNPSQELAFNNSATDGARFGETVFNDQLHTVDDSRVAGVFPAFALANQTSDNQENNNNGESPFGRLGIFLNGDFTFGDRNSTAREDGFDFDIFAFTAGVDYRFTDTLFLGLAFNYAHNGIDLVSNGGSLDSNEVSGSVYGNYYILENLYVDAIVTLGWVGFDTERNIRYSIQSLDDGGTTTVNQTANGNTDSTLFSFSVGTGYEFDYKGFTFGPYGRLDFIRSDIDGYSETIPGECDADSPGCGLALRFDSQDVTSLTTALGGQGSYAISTSFGVIQPTGLFGWIHEYENDSRPVSAFFVNDPAPGSDSEIVLSTDNPDRNYFELGVGVSGTFPHGISGFVYYQTLLALRDVQSHSFLAGLRFNL
jgi:uncharacterized protein YhjY with autotransporter beta-barrel domain